MSVVIDEVISETGEAPAAGPVAAATVSSRPAPIDMDRLDYEARRRRHRAERLWAD